MPEHEGHEGHEGHEARTQVASPRTADGTMATAPSSAPGQHSGSGRSSTLLDVIDRILDKGIVIDAWVSIGLLGLELLTIEARIVVSSIETYLRYAEAIAHSSLASVPQRAEPSTVPGSEPRGQVAEQQAHTMLQRSERELRIPSDGQAAATLDGLQQQLAQVIAPILAAHQPSLLQAIQPQLAPVVDLLRQRVRHEVQVALEPTQRAIQHELEQALEPVRDVLRDQFAQALEPVTAHIQEQVERTLTGASTGASPRALEGRR